MKFYNGSIVEGAKSNLLLYFYFRFRKRKLLNGVNEMNKMKQLMARNKKIWWRSERKEF